MDLKEMGWENTDSGSACRQVVGFFENGNEPWRSKKMRGLTN